MRQKDDAYILTDFQLQFLLLGIGCSSLYGLPQNKFNGDFKELYYQIHDLAVRNILHTSDGAFEICEPLKSWLFTAADAPAVYHILASGPPPRAFCAYLSDSMAVIMERYLYQKCSVRLMGIEKRVFYDEIKQILESCGIKEPKEPLPKELISKELWSFKQYLLGENQKKIYELFEKFSVEVADAMGEYRKRISVVHYYLENYLVAETGRTVDLFSFEMEKFVELLEKR